MTAAGLTGALGLLLFQSLGEIKDPALRVAMVLTALVIVAFVAKDSNGKGPPSNGFSKAAPESK